MTKQVYLEIYLRYTTKTVKKFTWPINMRKKSTLVCHLNTGSEEMSGRLPWRHRHRRTRAPCDLRARPAPPRHQGGGTSQCGPWEAREADLGVIFSTLKTYSPLTQQFFQPLISKEIVKDGQKGVGRSSVYMSQSLETPCIPTVVQGGGSWMSPCGH